MSRRNQIFAVLGIVSLLAALYFGRTEKSKRSPVLSPTFVAAPRLTTADLEVSTIITLPIAEAATTLNSADTLPADDLSTLELLFTEFRKNHGGNPVGENEEITAVLLGGNTKHLSYLPASGTFLDGSGKLIDRWGTPYFFHSLTASRTEIRSAGPDRVLWTSDDGTLTP
jgi:hypothetical protein